MLETQRLDDLVMPEAGPSLVHDLGFHHRDEILGFFIDDREQIFLPFGEIRIVVADKDQQVFVGLERNLVQIGLGEFLARVDFREWIGLRMRRFERELDLLVVRAFANRQVAAAIPRQCVRGIEDTLDLLDSDRGILRVAPHAHRMRLENLDRELGAGRAIGEVIFEKIVVPIDVRDGQNLQQQRVVAHQVGDRGIGIDHHLVRQSGDAVIVKRLQLLVGFAVRPVRVVRGHPGVSHVPEHPGVVANLEFLRVAIEAELIDLLANLRVPFGQIGECVVRVRSLFMRRVTAHSFTLSLARNALNDGQMSSLRSISTV